MLDAGQQSSRMSKCQNGMGKMRGLRSAAYVDVLRYRTFTQLGHNHCGKGFFSPRAQVLIFCAKIASDPFRKLMKQLA